MKKSGLTMILFLLAILTFAQSKSVQEFHDQYKDHGKYLSVHIEGGLLKMLSSVETNDDDTQEFLDAVSKIDAINIHSIDRGVESIDESGIKKFKKNIKKENYEELMIVRDNDATIDFLIKEKGGKISDLLLIVDEEDDFIILSISGEIDLKTVAKLSDNLDIKGGKHLKKIEEKE